MQGSLLRFYVHEGDRQQGRPLWEWLLTRAKEIGIGGGSALRVMAGFGRHHQLHEAKFFELAGALAVQVEFLVTEAEARTLLEQVRAEKLQLVYARIPACFDVTGHEAQQPPAA